MGNQILLLITFLAMTCALVIAFEPSPLQDFCVADTTSSGSYRINGFPCLDSKLATAEHFFFSGLHIPGNTSNPVGGKVTPVNVGQIPGLNTLGISLARIDYAPWGVIPPHTHPRATEILTVLEGSLNVGFVTSNPNNKLISKVLNKGDVFVFPVGLVHYQQNVGNGIAISLSSLSSQNPGVNTIANAVFGSNPAISEDVLAKSFQVDKSVISSIQAKF
ncbi:putative germin-like protein 2-1 isoform X2 [Malus sylvestris]|uniref:putative germin-like protein 2-1 isoform X2 n=1 Tax=Malus sylvestris TaxID=3752 RepID=UPI000499205E|nr:putative germin-like protein 2-1 isoform X2 [Malus sylvestris]